MALPQGASMLVLEHIPKSDARVLTIRLDGRADELFDKAQRGDRMYTIPDREYRSSEQLIKALQGATWVDL